MMGAEFKLDDKDLLVKGKHKLVSLELEDNMAYGICTNSHDIHKLLEYDMLFQ